MSRVFAFLGLFGLLLTACGDSADVVLGGSPDVVLYCGVDQDQSQAIVKQFEKETGLKVDFHGETEAMRSIGLPQRLVLEKDRPRADVYWSNEIMHMIDLVRGGVMDKLPEGLAEEFPEPWRDPKGMYVAFGARARIFLVNTELLPDPADHPKSLEDLMNPKYFKKGLLTCMAEPLTGTTYTDAVSWLTREEEGTKAFLKTLVAYRDDGRMKLVSSNGRVMRAVKDSSQKVAFGLTDTDDAWIAIQEGKPVKIVYPGQQQSGCTLIPNTAALVRGRPHPEAAEKLLRWIVSAENEARLAKSRSAQIPLREGVEVPADGHVKRPGVDFKARPIDWAAVGTNADRWRDWLTDVFKAVN